MARWYRAAYLGPPDGNWGGATIEHRGLVEHIAEGSYQGTIGWQRNPVSDVSSHFVIDFDGACAQMLDTDFAAWTQADGNGHWVSAELAGFHTGSYTPAQQETLSQLYAWLHATHGVPLQLTDSPSGRGWGWHGMGGAAWGNHPDCPGPANVALRAPMLARTIQILNPEESDMDAVQDNILKATNNRVVAALVDGVSPMNDTPGYGPNKAVWAVDTLNGIVAALQRIEDALSTSAPGAGATTGEVASIVRAELDKTRFLGSLTHDPQA